MSRTAARTVAVTGLNATDNPAPGVGVLRCLRHEERSAERHDERPRLVGLAYDALDPGIYAENLADDVFMLPYPSSSPEHFLDRLREIAPRTGISVIVPTLDAELPTFIEIAPRLLELGIHVLLPTREQFEARSKVNLAALARRVGLRTPDTLIINSVDELLRAPQRMNFPFFLKGIYYGAKLVTSTDEALAAFHTTVAQWGLPVIVQASIAADAGEERNIVALGDGRGGLIGALPMKKLALTDKGKGWAGITIRDPELLTLAHRFAQGTNWRGPCELEVVRARDGSYNLIEINPRFPAWVYLAAAAGMNLPRAAVALAAGEQPPALHDYTVGTMFVRISLDQIASISTFEQMVMNGELHHPAPKDASEPRAFVRPS